MNTESRIAFDITVVGGGILGLSIAAFAAQRGFLVGLYRMSDHGLPRAETLRNMGWLQSGLMYVDRFKGDRDRDRILASKMQSAGRRMLLDLELEMPPDCDRGVVRVRDEAGAENLEGDARALRLEHIGRLEESVARRMLGELYEVGIYYSVPDVAFPEAAVLMRLRNNAHREGAHIFHVQKPVSLRRLDGAPGLCCICNGAEVTSKVTIAAAGAGNGQLLRSIGLDLPMKLRQTPLLVLPNSDSVIAPVFADRTRGFSFVSHLAEGEDMPVGKLVVGTRAHRDVEFAEPENRSISQDELDQFEGCLPPCLRERMGLGRFTAGYEVIPNESLGLLDVEPWVEWLEEIPGLLIAMPGRATMGMKVARDIVDEVVERIGAPSTSVPSQLVEPRGSDWNEDIYMHFHPHYDFDDSKRTDGGS